MRGMSDEDLRRTRIAMLVRQTPAHMAITELVNATRHEGWLKGAGLEHREESLEQNRRRDVLEEVIADIWLRLRQAEARIAELSKSPEP